MEGIQVLFIITAVIFGFGSVVLLGRLLPHDDEDER